MKVALVHEWFTTIGGSENVFKELYSLFPDADIYALVAENETLKALGIDSAKVTTSFIQRLPLAKKKYRSYLPLFPLAVEQFDLSSYDLIVSSSHAVAKGVLTYNNQIHICYCHSPIRYAWDLQHQYLKQSGLNNGIKGFIIKYFLHRIRTWDVISSNRVDYFISNSDYIGRRIKKTYGRESTTIHPGVETNKFVLDSNKEDYYFTCSRFVPYKKIDLIVDVFNELPNKKLIIIGDGPDFNKIKQKAGKNVTLLGYQPFDILKNYMSKAKAFVFAAEEDFGIVPVEAQACGTPVIAYRKGGVVETIIENITGIFYNEQTVESLKEAIERFDAYSFDYQYISEHASIFSNERFIKQFSQYLNEILHHPNVMPQNIYEKTL